MSRRSRIPYTDAIPKDLWNALDRLDRRRLAPIADLAGGASSTDIINKVNALLAEMRLRDAMEDS